MFDNFSGEDASSESSDAAKAWEGAIRQALMPVQTPGVTGIKSTTKPEKEKQDVTPDSRYGHDSNNVGRINRQSLIFFIFRTYLFG